MTLFDSISTLVFFPMTSSVFRLGIPYPGLLKQIILSPIIVPLGIFTFETILFRAINRIFFSCCEKVFSLFPILKKRQKQLGGTLSGGEQQMLAISRALMGKPKLLLLDEPSLGLAPLIVKQIFEILRKINQEHQTTIFLVEQNANLALRSAHRGYVLENGKIILQDQTSKLLDNDEVKKAYLGVS